MDSVTDRMDGTFLLTVLETWITNCLKTLCGTEEGNWHLDKDWSGLVTTTYYQRWMRTHFLNAKVYLLSLLQLEENGKENPTDVGTILHICSREGKYLMLSSVSSITYLLFKHIDLFLLCRRSESECRLREIVYAVMNSVSRNATSEVSLARVIFFQ